MADGERDPRRLLTHAGGHADELVADPGLTNDAGDPLGLSGEVVTVDDGFGGVQTSLQITSTDMTASAR